jgi:biotin-[acetyl-CoA-carboxylase] ligase BirA-like protein
LRRLVVLPEVGSTNTWLKDQRDFHRPYTGVRAVRQTAGRGRLGRSWHSDADGDDLTCSFVVPAPRAAMPLVPLFAATALHAVISRYLEVKIKWPNDILCDGKKLAGILCEQLPGAANLAIVGIGVNVNSTEFPETIAANPTSFACVLEKKFSVQRLWLELYRQLCHSFRKLEYPLSGAIIRRYNEIAYRYVRRPEIAETPLEFKTLLGDGRAVFHSAEDREIILDTAE